MKLFTARQIRAWDECTIRELGIRSVDLMETAAQVCSEKILKLTPHNLPVHIFCGPGNNGGDGLAITRILLQKNRRVYCYLVQHTGQLSEDHLCNAERLEKLHIPVTNIRWADDFPIFTEPAVIIDALLGTGLQRPLDGLFASLIDYLNKLQATRLSIDIPSGMYADHDSSGSTVFRADHTLSFQTYKRSFLFAENESFTGQVHILNIGLSKSYYEQQACDWAMTDMEMITSMLQPRKAFSHKGDYGHAALAAGSRGMMGAATLAAGGCLQSGAGKLTCYVPAVGYEIMQTARPEAMCIIDGQDFLTNIQEPQRFDSLGIGPGLSMKPDADRLFDSVLKAPPPQLILDADALNLLAERPSLLKRFPSGTIITPHPKEFDRLAGNSENNWERLDKAIRFSKEHQFYIILKGHFSRIICPDGFIVFNPTGNSGMAKGGSGDVLTGLLTGLSAQGYGPKETAILGTYLHGLAGDLAAAIKTEMAMTASDQVEQIPHAWAQLR